MSWRQLCGMWGRKNVYIWVRIIEIFLLQGIFLLAQIYSGFTPHCQFPVRIIIERVSADVYQDHHRFTLNILSKSNLTFLMLLLHYFHSDLLKINIEPFVIIIAQPIYIKASLAMSFFLTYFRSTLTSTHTSGRYYLVCTQF